MGAAFLVATLLAASMPFAYPSWDYYVSPSGTDSSACTQAAPCRTVQRAADNARIQHILDVQIQDVTIHEAAGDYSTLALGPNDSGQHGFSVVYKCDGSVGTCRHVGGVPVSGWATYSGSVSRAAVTTGNFWTMYENEKRARLARTPNFVAQGSFPAARGPYYRVEVTGGPANSLTVVQYKAIDFDPSTWVLGDTSMYINPGGDWNWTSDIVGFSALNTGTRRYTTDRNLKFITIQNTTGSRYIMQGDYSMLDQCGEYFWDRNDTKGAPGGGGHYLYYWPCDGAIASQTIVVPTSQKVISLVGTGTVAAMRVHNVTFDGIEVEYSDFQQEYSWGCPTLSGSIVACGQGAHPYQNYDYEASRVEAHYGAMYLSNTDHITVKRAHFKATGLHAIYSDGYGRSNVVQDSLFEHTAGGGVFVENNYPGEGDINGGWLVTDIKVHDFGEIAAVSSGVTFANSGHNTLSYAEIYYGQRKAVWLYTDSPGIPQASVYTVGNLVDHVLAHDVNQDTGDTGALGVSFLDSFTGGPYVVNTFTQCIVHDVAASADMLNVAPDCVFADNDSYGQVFTNVQAYTCQGNQFRSNASGEHVLTNTSFTLAGGANGSFNAGLMDTANIGVTASYPY